MANYKRSTEQLLIDIIFGVAVTINSSKEYFRDKTNDEVAEWVAGQLRACGFDTEPMGASWGVLKKKDGNERV